MGQLSAQSGPSKVDTSGLPSTAVCAGDSWYFLIKSTTRDTGQHPAAMLAPRWSAVRPECGDEAPDRYMLDLLKRDEQRESRGLFSFSVSEF
jgi:hypothetical protein